MKPYIVARARVRVHKVDDQDGRDEAADEADHACHGQEVEVAHRHEIVAQRDLAAEWNAHHAERLDGVRQAARVEEDVAEQGRTLLRP